MKKSKAYLWVLAAVVAAGASLFLLRGQFAGRARAQPPGAAAEPVSDFKVHDDRIDVPNSAVKSAGIRLMTVKTEAFPVVLSISGKTGLDMELVAHVHAQFGGKVVQVVPQLGDMVKGPEAPEDRPSSASSSRLTWPAPRATTRRRRCSSSSTRTTW